MRWIGLTAAALIGLPGAAASQPAPAEVLRRIDANMTIRSAIARARMIITYRSGDVRSLEFRSWSEGTDRSFLEFTAPARDAGSRFLRLEDNMWIFLPTVGKSVRIQGHMLRQGMMGSDFSYGDASERPSMVDDYDAVVSGRDSVGGRPALVLDLTAKRDDLAYPGRKIWVDAERFIPLREERFAKSGKLLKTATLGDVRRVGDRWYPFSVELDDALQRETSTRVDFLELDLGTRVPPEVFTLRHLERTR
ncbi:MAG: outer membrane lipoprotein-sorting protein [Gemmatimonadales bacterium]